MDYNNLVFILSFIYSIEGNKIWLLKNADIMKGKSKMKVETQKKRLDKNIVP